MRGCFCLCVRKVRNAKKRTDKFQEVLLPSCEESKECKETYKQILEEGRRCCMRKSKECKELERQIPEEAVTIVRRKEKKDPGSARYQGRRIRDPCPGSPPHLRRRTRDPCPGSARHQRSRIRDLCPGSERQRRRRREKDPGSIPGICNGATREEEGDGSGFKTWDL
jgi:hypothetical protein